MIGKALKVNLAYAIGSATNSAALFLLVPYLVNALTPGEYGAWSLLEIGILLLSCFLLAGLDVGLMREYWLLDGEKERARLAGTALIAAVVWGVLLTGLLGAALFVGRWHWDFPGAPYTLGLALGIGLLEAVFALLLTIFRIREKALTFVALSVGRLVSVLGLSIGLVQAGGGIAGALAGRLLASTLSLGVAVVLGRHYLVLKLDWARLRRMARYGLPLLPANLASYVLFASDRYVLQYFSTLEVVGIYTFAYKVATTLDVLITRPFALDWAPRRFKIAAQADAPHKYAQVLLIYLYGGALFSLVVLAATPTVYVWIAPARYWEGMRVVPVILAAYLIYGLSYPLNVGIMLKDQTRYLPLIGWLAAGVCLALNLWLIPNYGMLGAAWATLIAYGVWTGAITWVSLRLYPIAYPGRSILWCVLGTFLAYLWIWETGRLWGTSGALSPLLVRLGGILLIFTGIGYMLWGRWIWPQVLGSNKKTITGSEE